MTLQANHAPLVFSPTESHTLGISASQSAGIEFAALEERHYEGGEFKLRPMQSVRDRTVFVLQSLVGTTAAPISQRLLRLLFLMQGLRDAGAARRIAVIPYLAFARKDRRTSPRDPVYSRYVAQLLEAAATDRVVALDVHNAAALDNSFRIPVDHLSALPMMADHFSQHLPAGKLAVASPDIGGIKRAQQFRELLEKRLKRDVDLLFIEKRRKSGVVSGGAIVGDAADCSVIVLDDLCATGDTLVRAAAALRTAGAREVHVAVTHTPVASGLAAVAAADDITGVVVTDSVGQLVSERVPMSSRETNPMEAKMRVLAIAPLLGSAIGRIARGVPLSPLFKHWPPPPV
jgi:ribose-phosphate pyrophosphokinase